MKLCNFRVGARWRVRPDFLGSFCSQIMFAVVTEKRSDDLSYRYEVPEHGPAPCAEHDCLHGEIIIDADRAMLAQIAVPEEGQESP